MNEELKKIKKIYGEEMMHLCRSLFPSILEKEGLLLSILEYNLAPTHSFASDIINNHLYVEFKNWIYSFIDARNHELELAKTEKTPFELMDEAGYTLYECKTEEDIQSFKKYYRPDECLCTIKRGGRLHVCDVFFAVKKNVDEIKREDFINPQREDEYGRSVISIQFDKGFNNDVSIKNRYNHSVNQPDCTFSNNLDNIIPGLTNSFEKYYGYTIHKEKKESDFLTDRLNYVRDNDGKYYRFNCECDNKYFCENNIILYHGTVEDYYAKRSERYLLVENYLIDRKDKDITLLRYKPILPNLEDIDCSDAFIESIMDVGKIKKIDVFKIGDKKKIIFTFENDEQVTIVINKSNSIVEYSNKYVKKIDPFFLDRNQTMEKIELPNVERIGARFMKVNETLSEINIPNVKNINKFFLYSNKKIKKLELPNVINIDSYFLCSNVILEDIYMPNVKNIEEYFLPYNRMLKKLDCPNLKEIGDRFLPVNDELTEINIPNVIEIGDIFLHGNKKLTVFSAPKVRKIGDHCLGLNEILEIIYAPKVETIGNFFCARCNNLREINLNNSKKIGSYFLNHNKDLQDILLSNPVLIGALNGYSEKKTDDKPKVLSKKR